MNKLISVTLIWKDLIRKGLIRKSSDKKRSDKKRSQLILERTIGLLYSLPLFVYNVKQLRVPSFEFAISDLLRVWPKVHVVSMPYLKGTGA